MLLVLLDQEFNAFEIHEADREAVLAALAVPGSKAREERNALAVSKFKAISRLRWLRPSGPVPSTGCRGKAARHPVILPVQ
jgi:hypothetical protein